jgi:hypothetical protein
VRRCTVQGCNRLNSGRGLCSTHYQGTAPAEMTHGDLLSGAYRKGIIDWRNGHPRRVDIADTSEIGQEYTRGYDTAPHLPRGR